LTEGDLQLCKRFLWHRIQGSKRQIKRREKGARARSELKGASRKKTKVRSGYGTAPCGQLYGFHLTIEQTQLAASAVPAATDEIRSGAGFF
jgi:hypothetical protein